MLRTRILWTLVVLGGVPLAALGVVVVPVGALVACLALGSFVGLIAGMRVHETAPGEVTVRRGAAWSAGLTVAAVAAGAGLMLTGMVALLGPAALLVIPLALIAVVPWLLRHSGPRRGSGRTRAPIDATRLRTVSLGLLSVEQLCQAWRSSLMALHAAADGPAREQILRAREGFLNELERRNPAGFARWLQTGASADPALYLATG